MLHQSDTLTLNRELLFDGHKNTRITLIGQYDPSYYTQRPLMYGI